MKQGFPTEQDKLNAQENFVRFFEEYDKRRNLNFHKTFVEFSPYVKRWKKNAILTSS